MSFTVTKGKNKMILRDNNQLAAFLNNGWKLEQEKPAKAKAVKETAEKPAPKTRSRKATAD